MEYLNREIRDRAHKMYTFHFSEYTCDEVEQKLHSFLYTRQTFFCIHAQSWYCTELEDVDQLFRLPGNAILALKMYTKKRFASIQKDVTFLFHFVACILANGKCIHLLHPVANFAFKLHDFFHINPQKEVYFRD